MKNNTVLYDYAGREIRHSEEKSVSSIDRDFFFSTPSGDFSAKEIDKKPYELNAIVFACCWAIARNISRLKWYLYNVNKEEEKIYDHEVLSLLNYPNSLMTRTPFLQSIILSLLLPCGKRRSKNGGQCFVCPQTYSGESVDLSRGNIPDVLIPYTDDYIDPVTAKGSNGLETIVAWKFSVNGISNAEKRYGLNEIIRISQFNPYNWLGGISNYYPAQVAIMLDIKSDIHNESLFDNSTIPSGVLTTDGNLIDQQRKDAMRWWNETAGGARNAYRTPILSNGLKYQHIGLTNVDLQYKELKDMVEGKVRAVYGINKIALGKYEQINYATIREGRRMLWSDTYLPIADMICEAFNSCWISNIDRGLRIGLDTSGIEALQKNYKDASTSAAIMVEKMFFPPALAARKCGITLTESELKEAPWLIKNPVEIRSMIQQSENKTDEENDDKEKSITSKYIIITKEERDNFWYKYIERVFDPTEKKYITVLRSFFNRQRNEIQDNIDEWLRKQKKSIVINIDDLLLDKKVEDKIIIDDNRPVMIDLLKTVEGDVADEIGGAIAWKVTDEKINKFLNARAKFLRGINTNTFKYARKEVQSVLDIAIPENWAAGKVAKELKKSISAVFEIKKSHAMTISRTETGSVSQMARFDAFKTEEIEKHEWLSARDEKTRITHSEEDGNVVKVGKRFPVTGLLHPNDQSANKPGEVINCRCVNVIAKE